MLEQPKCIEAVGKGVVSGRSVGPEDRDPESILEPAWGV